MALDDTFDSSQLTIDDSSLTETEHEKVSIRLSRGQSLDRYMVLEKLGEGGMGVVYKAYDPELDRQVAIKLLSIKKKDTDSMTKASARLFREAQALAQLTHPNVVGVYDVGRYRHHIYIVMELVKGTTLRQWQKEMKPNQNELLSVLIDAGQGLAAAHKAGLIHRDFKPDNVIVGNDGQTKVLDFGLARATDTKHRDESGDDQETSLAENESPLVQELDQDFTEADQALISLSTGSMSMQYLHSAVTGDGDFLGTPLYMAPEQFLDLEVDQQTDQFAYCITLFEALYGTRPFAGTTPRALLANVTRGKISLPAERKQIPAWLENIVLRGLAVEPGERYPTMDALLADLRHDPLAVALERRKTRQRNLIVIGSIALGCLIAVGGFLFNADRLNQRCKSSLEKLIGIWDNQVRLAVKDAFQNTQRPYAHDVYTRVEKNLDRYANAWTVMHTQACEATHVQGIQSEQMLDLRMGCLRKRKAGLAALSEIFSEKPDDEVLQKAVQASLSLGSLDYCADEEALQSKKPMPEDTAIREKVKQIEIMLTRVEALQNAGKYQQGLEQAQVAANMAQTTQFLPVVATAHYWLGLQLDENGKYDKAHTALKTAADIAETNELPMLLAKATKELIWVVGYRQAQYHQALALVRVAEVALNLAGGDNIVLSDIRKNQGGAYLQLGQHEEAISCFQQVLHIREKIFGRYHLRIARPLNNLGLVYMRQGKYEQTKALYERSLAIWEKFLGPDHPQVALSRNNLGTVYYVYGQLDQARNHYQKALDSRIKSLGENNPVIAASLDGLGLVENALGQHDQAIAYFQRSLTIREKNLAKNHPLLALPLNNLGAIFYSLGRYPQAQAHFRRALDVLEESLGQEHPNLCWALGGLGDVFRESGQLDKSLIHFKRALAICKKRTCEPEALGNNHFGLAQTYQKKQKGQPQALELARAALVSFRKIPYLQQRAQEARDWIRKHFPHQRLPQTDSVKTTKSKSK